MESEVFWSIVSDKMGGTRSREQCRSKWLVKVYRPVL